MACSPVGHLSGRGEAVAPSWRVSFGSPAVVFSHYLYAFFFRPLSGSVLDYKPAYISTILAAELRGAGRASRWVLGPCRRLPAGVLPYWGHWSWKVGLAVENRSIERIIGKPREAEIKGSQALPVWGDSIPAYLFLSKSIGAGLAPVITPRFGDLTLVNQATVLESRVELSEMLDRKNICPPQDVVRSDVTRTLETGRGDKLP